MLADALLQAFDESVIVCEGGGGYSCDGFVYNVSSLLF